MSLVTLQPLRFASEPAGTTVMWATEGGHQERLLARMALNNATEYCEGEVGVEQICNYKGLLVAMTGVGSRRTPEEGTAFLESAFASYPNIWRIAMWHKNQLLYQTGARAPGGCVLGGGLGRSQAGQRWHRDAHTCVAPSHLPPPPPDCVNRRQAQRRGLGCLRSQLGRRRAGHYRPPAQLFAHVHDVVL